MSGLVPNGQCESRWKCVGVDKVPLGALNSRFIVPSLFARAEVSAGRQLYKPASELRQPDYTPTNRIKHLSDF